MTPQDQRRFFANENGDPFVAPQKRGKSFLLPLSLPALSVVALSLLILTGGLRQNFLNL